MREDLVNLLQITPAFQMLPISVINQLASECELVYVTSGQLLVNQDEPGDCLYIVQSGRLRTFSQYGKNGEKILSDIIKGELIGELALFTESARAATVIAVRDSILWRLSKKSFDKFIQENPNHIMPIVKSTILRLLQPTKHLSKGIFNNLPVDVMRRMAPSSYIIGVRVAPSTDIRAHIPDGISSGLKRFLWGSSHLKQSKNDIPGIGEMITGSVLLCNDEKEVQMLLEADYPIEMDLSSFGLLDFSKINQLVEIGYQKTMEHLSKNPINIGL